MLDYWRIWLAAHPCRTKEWLKARIAEGFEIHHEDFNHANNHPDNLFLMEGTDHRRLHGCRAGNSNHSSTDEVLGEMAYRLRTESNLSWDRVWLRLQVTAPRATKAASVYSKAAGKIWPLPNVKTWKDNPYKRPVYRGY